MISTSTKMRELLIELTGYWMFKKKNLPIGCDIIHDLKNRVCTNARIIFDVGANTGQTAFKYKHYFTNAAVFSFEPVATTFEKLKENTAGLAGVKVFNSALGEAVKEVEISLFDSSASVLNSLKSEAMNIGSEKRQIVKVTTGDLFCQQNNITEIDLLKIDTEGYEINVLEGFTDMLRNSKINAIYCEAGLNVQNHRSTYLIDLIKFLTAFNFRLYGLYEVDNSEIKQGLNYGNLLFTKL